jgi:exonuclease VII large subunit
VFKNPLGPVLNATQLLDEKADLLSDALKTKLIDARHQLQNTYELLVQIEPHRLIGKKNVELGDLNSRMANALRSKLITNNMALEKAHSRAQAGIAAAIHRANIGLTAVENRLGALNPKSVLSRGYSIVRNKNTGALVTSPDSVDIGDVVVTEFAGEKSIESRVERK